MKRALLILSFLWVISNNVWADQRVMLGEASLTFFLPEEWHSDLGNNSLAMSEANPFYQSWAREPLTVPIGESIYGSLNITVIRVRAGTGIGRMSRKRMVKNSWNRVIPVVYESDGPHISNSLAYTFETPVDDSDEYGQPFEGADRVVKGFAIHAILHGKFVEIILAANKENFQIIEPEFRAIIKSIRADIDRPPITLGQINSVIPRNTSVVSITRKTFGAEIGFCVPNTVLGANLLQLVEKEIGLFRLNGMNKVSRENSTMLFSLFIYGDTSHLTNMQPKTCQ